MEVAILGYGVVGSGVAEVLRKNSRSIASRAGEEIKVKRILEIRDITEGPDKDLFTKNPDEVFNDPDISVVIETIGGTRVAHEFTKKAFAAGKNVVTSNKELVAAHGPELLKMARDNGVKYLFEASVGGGIPIIRPLEQCLAANVIDGITGILNGTTNFILSKMRREGKDFSEALKNAQQNGYAEADPTADVEGHDTCRKLAILSSIAYNEFIDYKNIYTEGISKITFEDIQYAQAMDSVIKLVAVSRRLDGKVFARVSPVIVGNEHPLAGVEDVFNAIVVSGDAIGDAMFYGQGAGKLPTASAVVADVIDIARHTESGVCLVWERKEENNVLDILDSETRYFVRVSTRNGDEAAKLIDRVFGEVKYINRGPGAPSGELAFTTARKTERELKQCVEELQGTASIKDVINVIRVEED